MIGGRGCGRSAMAITTHPGYVLSTGFRGESPSLCEIIHPSAQSMHMFSIPQDIGAQLLTTSMTDCGDTMVRHGSNAHALSATTTFRPQGHREGRGRVVAFTQRVRHAGPRQYRTIMRQVATVQGYMSALPPGPKLVFGRITREFPLPVRRPMAKQGPAHNPPAIPVTPPAAPGPSETGTGMAAEYAAIIGAPETQSASAALLALLTRLANCGLNADAPPLLHKAPTESSKA